MSHQVFRSPLSRLISSIPFGLGLVKPKHFRDIARVAWQNRDNPRYAWNILNRGVCDGCALGVAGLRDWTIPGVHLCMTRLNLLRLNTMPALNPTLLTDPSKLHHLHSLSNAQLRNLGRLAHPLLKKHGASSFKLISWQQAYTQIANRIRQSTPRRIAFYLTARGLTNEVYYVAQKVARFLGSNNIDNAARLCHAPSTAAMKQSLGVSASTCTYRDWYGSDLVIFFGSNPANDQPVTTKYLHEAKRLGTRVVLVNPYREPGMDRYWVPSNLHSAIFGTNIADFWFPVSAGGDIAFLTGVLKYLLANNWLDHHFIHSHTTGFAELFSHLDSLPFEPLEAQAGLTRHAMLEFAQLLHNAHSAVLVWSMGVTQHTFGADTVRMIINLALTQGFVGRNQCGLMPIRGHSSVQGGAEMGAYATALPGGLPVNASNASHLSSLYGFSVPDWIGLSAPEMIDAAAHHHLDLLYCLGGNFLQTMPDPVYVRSALANLPMRVHQDIILTDQMLIDASEDVLLLPAKTRYEQDGGGTETSTERRIMFSPELPRQVGQARSEYKILLDIAATTLPDLAHLLGCHSGPSIREEIARVVPFYDGIQNLKETGDSIQYGGPHLCAEGRFPTPDGKARFTTVSIPLHPSSSIPSPLTQPLPHAPSTSPSPPSSHPHDFIVSTRRGKQFNSLLYANVDPLNGAARDAILMNPLDASSLQLARHDRIALVNDLGRFEGRVFLAPIARRNLQIHWPEGNVLIHRGVVDPDSGVPDYNARARIERLP
jgi:molybdopterin-dependent oxidoreductase alpha subunit